MKIRITLLIITAFFGAIAHAAPVARCANEISFLTSNISKISFRMDAEGADTNFVDYVGLHVKRYETTLTMSDDSVVRYESHVVEYDQESPSCEILMIRRK